MLQTRKSLLVGLIVLLTNYPILAQVNEEHKGTLQLGIGGTLLGDWDHSGVVFFIQYQHTLNDYFSVTPRISSLVAKGADYIGEEIPGEEIHIQSSGMAFDIDLNYAPFRRFKDNFYLSVGPSVRYIQQTYPSRISKRRFPDGSTTFETEQAFYTGYAVGGTVAVNLAATIAPKISLGARGSLQVYTNGPLIPFYGLVVGRTL